MTPEALYTRDTIILPPQLCGSIGYYALMAAHRNVIIACAMRLDKRYKSVHRMHVADTRGPLQLTVPVSRPAGARRWCDVRISEHGHWWHVHRETLASAYGRTPFFEYYIDRLSPLLQADTPARYGTITALDAAWDTQIRSLLALGTRVEYDTTGSCPEPQTRLFNLDAPIPTTEHGSCHEPRTRLFNLDAPIPYYQVRQDEFGFIPDLSILDLLFNVGPESILHLDRLAATLQL